MVQLLVIAVFVSFHVHDLFAGPAMAWAEAGAEAGTEGEVHWSGAAVAMATVGPLLALALVGQMAAAGILGPRRPELWRRYARADRLIAAFRNIGIGWFIFGVLGLGWLDAVRAAIGDLVLIDELLAALPALGLIVCGWWSIEPLERRMRGDAVWTPGAPRDAPVPLLTAGERWAEVVMKIRHQMATFGVPVLLLSAWEETLFVSYGRLGTLAAWFSEQSGTQVDASLVHAGLQFFGIGLVFLLAPAIIRWLWRTVPIPQGEERAVVEQVCRRNRVRFRPPMLWRTEGRVGNAAVLGLIYPLRYLLFTDALLSHLTPRQLEAVTAHEVGHIRRHHIFWLGLSVLGTIVALGAVFSGLQTWMGLDDRTIAVLSLVSSLAALAGTIRLVGRRFEWQADAFAARDLSRSSESGDEVTPEAAGAVASALLQVSAINGTHPARETWRHGSIRTRVSRLESLIGLKRDRLPIDREVRRIKIGAAILLLAGVAGSVWQVVEAARAGA